MNNETKIVNLCDLPKFVIINIVSYLTNSYDYNNFRITNKKIYNLVNIIKKFANNKRIQEIYIENQYYVSKHYFPNNKLKLQNKYIINANFEKKKTSVEKEYYITGNIMRITNYRDGSKNGFEKIYFRNNIIKRQSFYKNGIKYKNEFINDIDGKIKYIIEYNFNYIYIKKYNKNVICYDIILKNNKLHGNCKYYVYGILNKSINFNNGLIQGKYKSYKTLGLNEILNYDNNKKNGIFLSYDYLKNIKLCGNYKNDKLHGIINFFVGNKINKSVEMNNGLLHGAYTEYLNFKKKFIFKDNELNGYYSEYRYTNILRLKIKFTNNYFNNIFKTYDIYGDLDKEYLFLNEDYIVKKYENNKLVYSLYKINAAYYLLYNNNKIKII